MPIEIDAVPTTATVVASQVLPTPPFGGDIVGLQLISGADVVVRAINAALDSAKARLFNMSLTALAANTTAAELIAAEAAFSNYPAGGLAVTFGAVINTINGAEMASILLQFNFVAPGVGVPVTDTVQGFWIEDADGNAIMAGLFTAPIPMAANGNAVAFVAVYNTATAVG